MIMTSNPYNVSIRNMRKWIKDLRTTDAPQVPGSLARVADDFEEPTIGYCCLGRLATLVVGAPEIVLKTDDLSHNNTRISWPEGGPSEWASLPDPRIVSTLATARTNAGPVFGHDSVGEACNVILATEGDEFFPSYGEYPALYRQAGVATIAGDALYASAANDDLKWPFAKIADALEARYLPDDWAKTKASRGE